MSYLAALLIASAALVPVMFSRLRGNQLVHASYYLLTLATASILVQLTGIIPESVPVGLNALWSGIIGFSAVALLDYALHHHPHTAEQDCECEGCTHSDEGSAISFLSVSALHLLMDGLLIATSFLVSPATGWASTAGVLAHEVPKQLGNFGYLLEVSGLSPRRAISLSVAVSTVSLLTAVTLVRYFGHDLPPMHLVEPAIAGGFVALLVRQLLPSLKRHASKAAWQTAALLAANYAAISVITHLAGAAH